MAEKRHEGGVSYHVPDKDYFEKRELRRHAGVFALWALGVGAVISGDFSGWNLGFAVGGWGGMFVATIIIAIMYLGLTYSIAEMSPALPHTGGAYSFARTAFGPWGGFITGIAENIEYVLTPAVVVYFIGTYMTAIVGTPNAFQPVWWIIGYVIFVGLNVRGVALSFKVTVIVTLLAIAILVFFLLSALFSGQFDFGKWAMNIGVGPRRGGSGAAGRPRAVPAIRRPRRACRAALCGVAVPGHRAVAARGGRVSRSEARHAEGHHARDVHPDRAWLPRCSSSTRRFRATAAFRRVTAPRARRADSRRLRRYLWIGWAKILSLFAVAGLVASFHAIIFAYGRQIFSLSRAGYFPHFLSVTHGDHKTPNMALVAGGVVGLAVMLVVWFAMGGEAAGTFIGSVLLNMAVFGAMFSYLLQALTFLQLRRRFPNIERPYRSPFGVLGASLTVIIALVTIYFQLTDPLYRQGVIGVAIWYILAILYFAAYGRKTLVFSPEEAFAVKHREGAVKV